MTFEEINRKLKWNKAFVKYFYSLGGIALSSFFIYMLFFKKNIIPSYGYIIPIITGLYVFYVAWKVDKFTIIENELTETENTTILKKTILEFSNALMSNNYASYTHYQKNFWGTPYEVYLYAGDYFIAINIKLNYTGIIDLGRSDAQKKKIIKLFEKHKLQTEYQKKYNHKSS